MGKHSAAAGAFAHPIVAAALTRRTATGGAHQDDPDRVPDESPVGWPGPPPAPDGGGVGWPGRTGDARAGPAPRAGAESYPSGWRRLFGVSRAA